MEKTFPTFKLILLSGVKQTRYMSHTALNIESWIKINSSFTFDYRSRYDGLNIDASKFYFYLKDKFGIPSILYSSVAKFFPERKFTTGNEWVYLFKENSNYIIITGDDKINIAVFSLSEAPNNLDYEIFANKLNEALKRFSLEGYFNNSYELYINYSFYLKNLISQFKDSIVKKIPPPPKQISLIHEDINSQDPEVKYKYIEFSRDYNAWLKAVLEKAQFALQLQILLPIHFESIISLAFRLKLKKEFRNDGKNYSEDLTYQIDIYDHFEKLTIPKKIELIRHKCFEVNQQKIIEFQKKLKGSYDLRSKRNNFLHGNALFFQNLNLKYYLDENRLIGFPDRARAMRAIASSISVSTENKNLLGTITTYEDWCDQFIDVFDDNNYFKDLVGGIAFAHNSKFGGTVSISLNKYEDLFAPQDWSTNL